MKKEILRLYIILGSMLIIIGFVLSIFNYHLLLWCIPIIPSGFIVGWNIGKLGSF